MKRGMVTRFRTEKDSMGEMQVPENAYWGAETQRAVENFPISGIRFPRKFIRALALIKMAAAGANMELGVLDQRLGEAILEAAGEVLEGKLDEHFVLDIFQTGSGTSTNMNANEVIAHRANEILGGKVGEKKPVHPNDHVNQSQSSNDVIPSAIHISALEGLERELIPALKGLEEALGEESRGIRPGHQNRADSPAGRDPHPAGPGIQRLCKHGETRDPEGRNGPRGPGGTGPGRDGRGHGDQYSPPLCRAWRSERSTN